MSNPLLYTMWTNVRARVCVRGCVWVCRFDGVRNFSVMRIHANNLFHRDVRVFASVTVFDEEDEDDVVAAEGGSVSAAAGVRYDYRRDSVSQAARSVFIPLRQLVARSLTVRVEFDARWVMFSEVQFVSGALGNDYSSVLQHSSSTVSQAHATKLVNVEDQRRSCSFEFFSLLLRISQ